MINYVEPYSINGSIKTLFYTEVNTNLKLNDRVFILNGNYDSNTLIKDNKLHKSAQGYKILFIDRCKMVLDIDYTGKLPYSSNETTIDDLNDVYKIHYVNSLYQLDVIIISKINLIQQNHLNI